MNIDANKRLLITALLVGGSLILFFNVTIYADLLSEDRHVTRWSAILGVIFLLCGVLLVQGHRLYDGLNARLQRAGIWLGISPLQVLLLITSPVFTFLAVNASGFWPKMRSPHAAVAAWLIGIGLALAGGWKREEARSPLTKTILYWFVGLTLFALLIRGIAVGKIPIVLTGDEASSGTNAILYAQGAWDNLFITSWFSFPSLFSFVQSLPIRILGNTIEAVRIPSVLAGALTIGVVYFWGRAMFGQRAGVFAALILATLSFDIHSGRLGTNNIWDALWFALTVGALWYGWKTQARWAYLLAGLGLGFSQYFYSSSKALLGVIFMAALLALLLQRTRFREQIANFCLTLLVALTIFVPLGWFYLNQPAALLTPFARVSMVREITASVPTFRIFLSQQLPVSLGAYTYNQFPASSFWYPSETALLRPLAATFFYIGLIFLLFRDRDSRLLLLGLWLLGIALLNAFSSITPAPQRYVAAAPACALIVGYGLHQMAETLGSLWSKSQKMISGIAYLMLVSIMVGDLYFYFMEFVPFTRLLETSSNGMIAHQFGSYLRDQPADTQLVVFGGPRLRYNSPAVLYLAPHIKGVDAPQDWASFDRNQLISPRVVFVFLPEYQIQIEAVQHDYPGGTLSAEKAWNGDVLYWVYERNR